MCNITSLQVLGENFSAQGIPTQLRVEARVDCRGIDVVGLRVDVGEDGRGAAVPDGVCRRDEGQRWDDHLVARSHTGHVQRELERGRAVGRRDGVGGAGSRCEGGLEFAHAWAL